MGSGSGGTGWLNGLALNWGLHEFWGREFDSRCFMYFFSLFRKISKFLAGTGVMLNTDYITSAGTATLKSPIPVLVL